MGSTGLALWRGGGEFEPELLYPALNDVGDDIGERIAGDIDCGRGRGGSGGLGCEPWSLGRRLGGSGGGGGWDVSSVSGVKGGEGRVQVCAGGDALGGNARVRKAFFGGGGGGFRPALRVDVVVRANGATGRK